MQYLRRALCKLYLLDLIIIIGPVNYKKSILAGAVLGVDTFIPSWL